MILNIQQQQQAVDAMKMLGLFAGCSDEQLAALASRLNARDVIANKVVLMDQEIGKTLYLLIKGSVSVFKRVGGEKTKLAALAAPNFFGERTMFEESPASALVKTDAMCTVYTLEKNDFDQVAAGFPTMHEQIHKNMEIVRAQRMGPVTPTKEE